MYLSDKTKKSLERSIGLSYEKIIKMDVDEEIAYVEKKIGKKLEYPRDKELIRSTFYCNGIRTMDEVNEGIDNIGKNPFQKVLTRFKNKR